MPNLPQTPFTAKKSDRFLHQKRQKNNKKGTQKRPVAASKMPESFLGVPCRKVTFRVPSKEERAARRLEFEQEKRAEFIKFLAKTQRPALLAAGITKKQIAGMENGFTPHGFNTHHKLPIYGGGKNEFSNFILIKNDPYHTDIHKVSDLQICQMQDGETKTVKMPVPDGSIFIPPSEKQRVLAALKQPVQQAVLQKMRQTR